MTQLIHRHTLFKVMVLEDQEKLLEAYRVLAKKQAKVCSPLTRRNLFMWSPAVHFCSWEKTSRVNELTACLIRQDGKPYILQFVFLPLAHPAATPDIPWRPS
jgi:hypothetical protein